MVPRVQGSLGRSAGVLACCLILAASLRAETRVALVPGGGGGDRVASVVDLGLVRLSTDTQVTLLERREIDRILAEHKLTLGGLTDATKAIAIGQLLSVDVFAVIESGGQSQEVLGLVVFDAQTGLRLADETLAADLETAAGQVADLVRGSLAKRRRVADGLRPMCVVSVRNADLPREMDTVCQSVGVLVERGLLKSPGAAVLERRRLEHVNRERQLEGSPRRQLWAGLVLLELEVGRDDSGEGLRGAALLTDAEGHRLHKVTAATPRRDFVHLSDELQRQAVTALGQSLPASTSSPAREAQRFAQEAALLHAHGACDQAVHASEAACALDAERQEYRDALIRQLLDNADDLLRGGKKDALLGFEFQPDPKHIGPAVAQLSRAVDLWREVLSAGQPFDEARLGSYQRKFLFTQAALTASLIRLAYVRPGADEQRQDVARVRGKVRELCCEFVDIWANLARRNPQLMGRYTSALFDMGLSHVPRFSNTREAYLDDLTRLIGQWLEVRAAAGPAWSANRGFELSSVMGPWLRNTLRFESQAWGLTPALYADRIQPLAQTMERHPHPVIQLYGNIGQLWCRKARGELDVAGLDSPLEAIKSEAWRVIANPAPWPPAATRQEAYRALLDAVRALYVSDDRAQSARVASRQAMQFLSICEVLAERGELLPDVVTYTRMAIVQGLPAADHRPRLAAILDRLLEKAADRQVETFGQDLEAVRTSLRMERDSLASQTPARSTTASRPWQTAQKVFDVQQLPGTFQIQRGLVQEGTFYCAGWGPGVGFGPGRRMPPPGIHGVAVPLDGSKPRQLASVPHRTWSNNVVVHTAVGPREFVAAIQMSGIAVFPLDGSPARILAQAEGLPTADVECVAVLGRTLYAGLKGGGYLVACDLETNRVQVLASAARRETTSPLDNTGKLRISCLVADPERNRVLCVANVDRLDVTRDERTGIWELDGKSRQLRQVRRLYTSAQEALSWASQPLDGRILLNSTMALLSFDCRTQELAIVQCLCPRELAPGLTATGSLKSPALLGFPPFAVHEGWLWSGWHFHRVSLSTDQIEPLTPPERLPDFDRYVECLQVLPGGQRLLVAHPRGAWLLGLSNSRPENDPGHER